MDRKPGVRTDPRPRDGTVATPRSPIRRGDAAAVFFRLAFPMGGYSRRTGRELQPAAGIGAAAGRRSGLNPPPGRPRGSSPAGLTSGCEASRPSARRRTVYLPGSARTSSSSSSSSSSLAAAASLLSGWAGLRSHSASCRPFSPPGLEGGDHLAFGVEDLQRQLLRVRLQVVPELHLPAAPRLVGQASLGRARRGAAVRPAAPASPSRPAGRRRRRRPGRGCRSPAPARAGGPPGRAPAGSAGRPAARATTARRRARRTRPTPCRRTARSGFSGSSRTTFTGSAGRPSPMDVQVLPSSSDRNR